MKDQTKDLTSLTVLQIERLSRRDLIHLCRDNSLDIKGTRPELIERLLIYNASSPIMAPIPMPRPCNVCGSDTRICNTRRRLLSNGDILISRCVRCEGKHHHKYELVDVEKPKVVIAENKTTKSGGQTFEEFSKMQDTLDKPAGGK